MELSKRMECDNCIHFPVCKYISISNDVITNAEDDVKRIDNLNAPFEFSIKCIYYRKNEPTPRDITKVIPYGGINTVSPYTITLDDKITPVDTKCATDLTGVVGPNEHVYGSTSNNVIGVDEYINSLVKTVANGECTGKGYKEINKGVI